VERETWFKLVGFFTIIGAIAALLVVPEVRKILGLESQVPAQSVIASPEQKPTVKDTSSPSQTIGNQTETKPKERQKTAQRVTVDPTQKWQDTGIKVLQGETIELSATGSVTWAGNADPNSQTVGPDGTWYEANRLNDKSGFPMLGAKCGALIMRIGSSVYEVGQSAVITAGESGTIRFMVNDRFEWLHDNTGSFTVIIKK
jgi:hypothetical protein